MKTATEWSAEFDIMWNNIMSNQAPGLSEYEKSVFLTNAQEQLILDYLSPKTNIKGEGFDDSLLRQSDFDSLIVIDNMASSSPAKKLDSRSTTRYFKYPSSDILVVLNESCREVIGTSPSQVTKEYVVVPISYAEYMRMMQKPFKYPVKGTAWRLNGAETTADNVKSATVELIARFTGTVTYVLRYVKRPSPIVLASIPVAIEGVTTAQTCTLPEHLHQEILRRAVNLAKIAWSEPAVEQQR